MFIEHPTMRLCFSAAELRRRDDSVCPERERSCDHCRGHDNVSHDLTFLNRFVVLLTVIPDAGLLGLLDGDHHGRYDRDAR